MINYSSSTPKTFSSVSKLISFSISKSNFSHYLLIFQLESSSTQEGVCQWTQQLMALLHLRGKCLSNLRNLSRMRRKCLKFPTLHLYRLGWLCDIEWGVMLNGLVRYFCGGSSILFSLKRGEELLCIPSNPC